MAIFSVWTEDGWGNIIRTDTMEVTVYTTAQCADPVASPAGGEFASFPQPVTLTCPTAGADAKIHYTTNGSTPTASDPSVASGGSVSVGAGQTLNAISISPYYANSGVISETYTQMGTCATPTASPPGGSYLNFPQTVTLSCVTPGANIFYTLDGSTPTAASASYTGPIGVSAGQTLKAIAILGGMVDSAVMSATYTQGSVPPVRVPSVGVPPVVFPGPEAGEPVIQPKPTYEQAKIGRCKEWVNVRSGPGVEYDIIGQAYLGEVIELLQWDKTETWCKVLYNGGNNTGWVHGRFIVAL